jgi:hypothetical protein
MVPATGEAVDRWIMVQASLGKKVRPYLENNLKQKRLEMWLKW